MNNVLIETRDNHLAHLRPPGSGYWYIITPFKSCDTIKRFKYKNANLIKALAAIGADVGVAYKLGQNFTK